MSSIGYFVMIRPMISGIYLVKRTADLSMTSTCLNCLLRSLACLLPWLPVPPHRIRMNFIPF